MNKRFILWVVLSILMLNSCYKDDVEDLKKQVTQLNEQQQTQAEQLRQQQFLLEALNNKLTVTNVTSVDGKYTITLSNGEQLTMSNTVVTNTNGLITFIFADGTAISLTIYAPQASIIIPDGGFVFNKMQWVRITPTVDHSDGATYNWLLDENIISTEKNLFEVFAVPGNYTLTFVAKNGVGESRCEMPVIIQNNTNYNTFVTQLFEYLPAPGQHMNKTPGNMESAQGILGQKGMVGLGAFGGYIVLGFDHTVINTPGKEDFIVYGNAMTNFSEPGIVWVMYDENGNGQPDDTWYEIAGSEFGKANYERNYSVTYYRPEPTTDGSNPNVPWTDSKGNSGVVKTNIYNRQHYYPDWIIEDSYTLSGSLLKGKIDEQDPEFILSFGYEWGYADNTVGGDKIDIANAVDEQGNKIHLKGIDFVKIQTGALADMGALGELSTEVIGIEDLNLVP